MTPPEDPTGFRTLAARFPLLTAAQVASHMLDVYSRASVASARRWEAARQGVYAAKSRKF